MTTQERIRRNVKALVALQDTSMRQLAARLDMSPQALSERLSGLGQLTFLEKVAGELGVSVTTLIDTDPDNLYGRRERVSSNLASIDKPKLAA